MNELRLQLSDYVEGHFAASGSHLSSGYFTLNPAFFVKCVLADGRPADYCVRQEKEGYQTVTFSAPDCRTLTVEYEGVLDGTYTILSLPCRTAPNTGKICSRRRKRIDSR